MTRIFAAFIFCIIGIGLQAQDIAVSPYSAFGYGEKRFYNGIAAHSMAGISTAYLSPFGTEMNFINPAANQNLLFTNFTFEGTSIGSNFQSNDSEFRRSSSYISKISLGFPLGKKVRFGFGFQPYSAVGYRVAAYEESEERQVADQFEGDGGLNSLHAAVGYNITPNLAVGLRANYLFGSLDRSELFSTSDAQLTTSYRNNNRLNGTILTGGVSYTKLIDEKHRITLGATYGMSNNIKSNQDYLLSTFQFGPNGVPFNVDTIDFRGGSTKVKFPSNWSIGASYGKEYQWMVSTQVDFEHTSEFQLPNSNGRQRDRWRYAAGGYIIPKFNSFRSYFARVTYRAGVFYEETPVIVNDEPINNFGITFGLGLPIGKTNDPSELNIGVELGRRGDITNNLIRENYMNLRIGFNLDDSWFKKRKYD